MSDSPRRRALLYINRKSRRGGELAENAVGWLERAGLEIEAPDFDEPEKLIAFAKAERARFDTLIVGGGDGTIISAIPALRESELPLSILPLGTMNDLARTLEIPLDIEAACGLAASTHTRRLDVGRVNGKYFINEASIGLSTRIARFQTGSLKKKLGLLAVPYTLLLGLRHSRPFHVSVEGGAAPLQMRTLQLTVANSHHFGAFVTNEDAAIDDGLLDLYVLETPHWRSIPGMIVSFVKKRLDRSSEVRTDHQSRFVVRTRRPKHVFTDGEPATKTPAEFESLRQAIEVTIPVAGATAQ